jgi:hypothetical protein
VEEAAGFAGWCLTGLTRDLAAEAIEPHSRERVHAWRAGLASSVRSIEGSYPIWPRGTFPCNRLLQAASCGARQVGRRGVAISIQICHLRSATIMVGWLPRHRVSIGDFAE